MVKITSIDKLRENSVQFLRSGGILSDTRSRVRKGDRMDAYAG